MNIILAIISMTTIFNSNIETISSIPSFNFRTYFTRSQVELYVMIEEEKRQIIEEEKEL